MSRTRANVRAALVSLAVGAMALLAGTVTLDHDGGPVHVSRVTSADSADFSLQAQQAIAMEYNWT
ncbi:hypothetical protein [Kitasatospora sp. NPDC057015]|uniref:hypothetical protein n=1 Tax=Kitasatospora sp. NPDC057015 TaxID=3346001 RepID=UPI003633D3F6